MSPLTIFGFILWSIGCFFLGSAWQKIAMYPTPPALTIPPREIPEGKYGAGGAGSPGVPDGQAWIEIYDVDGKRIK